MKHLNLKNAIVSALLVITGNGNAQDFRGAYKKSDGKTLTMVPLPETKNLRMVEYETGERFTLTPTNNLSFSTEGKEKSTFEFKPENDSTFILSVVKGPSKWTAKKIPLREKFITFSSGEISLYGKLVLPTKVGKYPIVVIAHGSDNDSAVEGYDEPYLFASQGIACFIYDKRGTGKSGGEAILSFELLSSDLVAAVNTVSLESEIDKNKIGLSGYSQGGWIAPLAALKSSLVKFVVVNYGMTMSIAQEDWYETPLKLADRGVTDRKSMEEFNEVNTVLHREVKEDFKEGWYDRLESKINQYKGRPWMDSLKKIPTTWMGSLLNMEKEQVIQFVPPMMRTIQPFYDPITTLKKLNIPMLWLVAGDDIEAPPQITIKTIKELQKERKPFELKIYLHADHGMLLFEKQGNKRVYTKYADSYFTDVVSWIQLKTR